MEYCTLSRCLVCRNPILENLSIVSESLVSTANLLQNFLDCFHNNVRDSKVPDLSTSCQFCPNCVQFVAEWSSIQTKMTQLTQRAAQLKATLSALLLSAPKIIKQAHNNENITNIIHDRIQNSQEVELSLQLQQTVDDIRNELQKKYSVNVLVDKIQVPCPPSKLNQEELDPLSGHCDNDDEPMDDWRGDDDGSDPSEDQMVNEVTPELIFETSSTTKEETSSDDSNDPLELDEMKANRKSKTHRGSRPKRPTGAVQRKQKLQLMSKDFIPDGPNRFKYEGMSFQLNQEDQTYTCDECGFISSPSARSIRDHICRHLKIPLKKRGKRPRKPRSQTIVVPDGPNKFKYNDHGLKLNDEDQCYYCDACDFKGNTSVQSVLLHIRQIHFTEEEKQNLTAVQISDTEWVYGGEYKIIRVGEKLQCVSCGFADARLLFVSRHIRTSHVGMESADKVAPLQVTDEPPVKDLTPIELTYKSVPYTFSPAENKYTCGICQAKLSSARRNITRHITERHTDEALSVICEICGKELSNQRGYKFHMKKHLAEPKICPTCNKKFYCPKTFNRHLKIHLLGEAALKHQCEYCGKKFYLQAQYRYHVRIHTGETPYECGDCGMKFRLVTVLGEHRKRVHGVQTGSARNLIRINE